jgi:methionine sulfoxide reductase heme-binding subunit
MLAFTSSYLWYTTRATGLVTLVLFTAVVCLGTLVSNRVGGSRIGRFEFNELHRSLSLVAMAFLAVHIVTTIVDSYVPTGWWSTIIPMTSHYERLNIALGTVAFDLMLCVWVSSLMKTRIANSSWRFIHWFSWLAFVAAVVHSFLAGTDARSGIGLVVVTACSAAVFIAAIWRYVRRPARAAGRTALSPIARSDEATSGEAGLRR